MTTTSARIINNESALQIMNSRKSITRNDVGKQVVAFIQGQCTFQSAEEQRAADIKAGKPEAKQYFDKYIANLKANSQEAVSRRENKLLLHLARTEEAAGNPEVASQLYNRYLNAIQVSFNVIARQGAHKFADGEQVTCVVEEAITKEGHTALVVSNPRYKAPETLAKVTYSEVDLIDDFSAEEVEAMKAALTASGKIKATA